MQDLFPNHTEIMYMTDPAELSETEQIAYISHRNRSLSFLTSQLQLKKRNYSMFDFWWDVYNWYMSGTFKEQANACIVELTLQKPC